MTSTTKPALVVVDDQDATRTTIAGALKRRYGMDYDVVEARSAKTGRAARSIACTTPASMSPSSRRTRT